MADASKSPGFSLGGFVIFLIAAAGVGLAAYTYSLLIHERAERQALEKRVADWDPKFEKFKDAVREVDKHLSSVVYQQIEVPGAGWQPIVGGFYVIDLQLSAGEKGAKVAGKIINPTSVVHEGARFSMRVGDGKGGEKKGEFSLPRVPPGVAQPFEVTVPDVAPADVKRAYLSLDASTISFSSSTTRKGAGSGPLDTDKLLR
jgi:hypothetical protein